MLLLPGTVDGHSTGLNLHNLDLCAPLARYLSEVTCLEAAHIMRRGG